MSKIFIDAGHGGHDSGAVGYGGVYEKDIVLRISNKVKSELNRHPIITEISRTDDTYLTLTQRTDKAKNPLCETLISIHCNAFGDSSANGFEIWTHGTGKNEMRLANCVYEEYKNLGFRDRGIKQANGNLHMVREFPNPAILIELGFITNQNDLNLINQKEDSIVKSIVKGILNYFNVAYQEPVQASNKLYRVQVGAFSIRENALRLQEDLKNKGYSSFIVEVDR